VPTPQRPGGQLPPKKTTSPGSEVPDMSPTDEEIASASLIRLGEKWAQEEAEAKRARKKARAQAHAQERRAARIAAKQQDHR
jgi:hypothetical protein